MVYCAFFYINNKFLVEHTAHHYEYIKKVKYKQNIMEIYGMNQTKIGTKRKNTVIVLLTFFSNYCIIEM